MLLVTIDGHSAESEASQGLIPTKILQGSGEAVCFFYVFVLSCVCYVFVRFCLYVLCGHLLGKD